MPPVSFRMYGEGAADDTQISIKHQQISRSVQISPSSSGSAAMLQRNKLSGPRASFHLAKIVPLEWSS